MKIEFYLLRRFIGYLAFLTAVAVMLYLAVLASLQHVEELSLSPWGIAGPLAVMAAIWTVRRTRALGELRVLAAVPRSPLLYAVPVACLAIVFQLLVAVPQPQLTDRATRVSESSGVIKGLDGELLLRRLDRGVLIRSDGAVVPVDLSRADLPKGFYPEPGRRSKLRRWLFFCWSPLWAGEHPLDPWLLRWLYVLWHGFAVLVVMARRSARMDFAVLLAAGLVVLIL